MWLEKIIFIAYIGWLFILSIIAFFLYKKDKKLATQSSGPNRIKEKTLLSTTALGGAIGAYFGRILFHHKTDKKYFSLTIYFSILVEILTVGVLLYLAFIRKAGN